MALDLTGLTRLDTSGLSRLDEDKDDNALDLTGLKRLDTSGLSKMDSGSASMDMPDPVQPATEAPEGESWFDAIQNRAQESFDSVTGDLRDKASNIGTSFTRGLGIGASFASKGAGLLGAPDSEVIRNLDRIDRGESPRREPMMGTPIGIDIDPNEELWQRYSDATPEGRATIRASFEDSYRKAIDSPAYQAGEKMDSWFKENWPSDPELQDSFWLTKVPEALGSTGVFVVGGLIAAPIPGGSYIAPGALGSLTNRGSQFQDALDSGADMATALQAAEIAGITGMSEAILGNLFNRLDKGSGGAIRQLFKRALKQGSEEAVQEVFMGVMNDAVAQGLYDPERGVWTMDRAEEGAIGFSTGVIMEVITSALLPGRARRKPGDNTQPPTAADGSPLDTGGLSKIPDGAVPADDVFGSVQVEGTDQRVDGVRGTARREQPLPSVGDIESPIDTALITEGRNAVADAEAIVSASEILRAEGLPAVGSRVTMSTRDGGQVSGEVVDAFETTIERDGQPTTTRGAKIRLDDGRIVAETTGQLQGRIRVEGAAPPASATPINRVDVENGADTAVTPSGRRVPVQYAIVEAKDLITSQTDDGAVNRDYPAELQPRDRSRGVSSTQVREIATNLDPRLVDRSPRAGDGAPIVSPAGEVESGNGRVLGIRTAYRINENNSGQKYRDYLSEQGYPVDGMREPVLVRIRTEELDASNRAAFTREANERDTLGMSATEQAMADAASLDGRLLDLFTPGDIDSAANRGFTRAFLQSVVGKNDLAGMIGADGAMSQESIRRIQGALLAKAYGDADLVSTLIESTDNNVRAIGGALTDVSAQWASMREDAVAGNIDPAMDVTADLLEAVRVVQRARRENRSVREFVGQGDMLSGDSMSPVAEMLLSLFFRNKDQFTQPAGRDRIASALVYYTQEAARAQPGGDLLGDTVDAGQLLRGANERQYADEAQGASQGSIFDAQPDDRAGASDAQAGTRRSEQAEPGDSREAGAEGDGSRNQQALNRDDAQRAIYEARVEDMTIEEARGYITDLRTQVLVDERTGLGSNRAWLARDKKAHVASIDLDNLKWVNDNMGHDAGDRMIAAVGQVLKDQGLDAYHISGDEFYAQGDNASDLNQSLTRARQALAGMSIEGQGWTFDGPSFSWGTSTSIADAEKKLGESKTKREQDGYRAARGEQPKGASKAGAQQVPADSAVTDEQFQRARARLVKALAALDGKDPALVPGARTAIQNVIDMIDNSVAGRVIDVMPTAGQLARLIQTLEKRVEDMGTAEDAAQRDAEIQARVQDRDERLKTEGNLAKPIIELKDIPGLDDLSAPHWKKLADVDIDWSPAIALAEQTRRELNDNDIYDTKQAYRGNTLDIESMGSISGGIERLARDLAGYLSNDQRSDPANRLGRIASLSRQLGMEVDGVVPELTPQGVRDQELLSALENDDDAVISEYAETISDAYGSEAIPAMIAAKINQLAGYGIPVDEIADAIRGLTTDFEIFQGLLRVKRNNQELIDEQTRRSGQNTETGGEGQDQAGTGSQPQIATLPDGRIVRKRGREPWVTKGAAEETLKQLGLIDTHRVEGFSNDGPTGREYWIEPRFSGYRFDYTLDAYDRPRMPTSSVEEYPYVVEPRGELSDSDIRDISEHRHHWNYRFAKAEGVLRFESERDRQNFVDNAINQDNPFTMGRRSIRLARQEQAAPAEAPVDRPNEQGYIGEPMLAKSGKPFQTESSARASSTFKDLPYADVIPVDGGFAVVRVPDRQAFNPFTNEYEDFNTALDSAMTKNAPESGAQTDQEGADLRQTMDIAAAIKEYNDSDNGVTSVMKSPENKTRGEDAAAAFVEQNGGPLTVDQAQERIDGWRRVARSQKGSSTNNGKVVLSLFDSTGQWSKPWVEAGYDVYTFDIQNDPYVGDITNFSTEFFADIFGGFDGGDVHAILAACPCTDFAVSGAKHFAVKDANGQTIKSVELVRQTMAAIEFFKPAVWALENPVGRIEKLTGLPPWRYSFQPANFGDPYTKRTLLWGRFNPDLPVAPVEASEGSKMHSQFGGKSLATKNARSETPEGFAYAFFMANNAIDNRAMTVSNIYDQLDPAIVTRAVDAGLTDDQIKEAVDDLYYQDLDYEAANAELEAAIPSGTPPAAANLAAPQVVTGDVAPTRAPTPDRLYVSFGGQQRPVESVADARDKWMQFIEATQMDPSKEPREQSSITVYQGRDQIARISFNGKIWAPGSEYVELSLDADGMPIPETPEARAAREADSTQIKSAAAAAFEENNPVATQTAGVLTIEDYSDKSIIIRGETQPNKDRIKAAVPGTRALWNRKAGGWIFPKTKESAVREALTDLIEGRPAEAAVLRGARIDDEWVMFSQESGTKGIPRAQMPQVKAEHRGALTNFLNARDIRSAEMRIPASDLKPTQAEFSEKKVEKAKTFTGGDRAILSSSDGFVVDGHHQWIAAFDRGEDIRTIQLNATIDELLPIVAEMPSAERDGSTAAAPLSPDMAAGRLPVEDARETQRLANVAALEAAQAEEAPAAPAEPAARPSNYGASNKVFTKSAADEARETLRRKLGQLNTGLDPEIVQAGITLAGYHIEAGARSFRDFTAAMVADLGDGVRPYLRSWYEGVRYYPLFSGEGMTPAAEIERAEREGPATLTEQTTEDSGDGVQTGLFDGNAGSSAANVQQTPQDGGTGRAPESQEPGSAPNVQGNDGQRAEAAERVSERADGERSGARGDGNADRVPQRSEGVRSRDPDGRTGTNYIIEPGSLQEERGPITKAKDNIKAIELVREIEAAGRPATSEEQQQLARYVGWGGLKGAFPNTEGNYGKGFEKIGPRLKELLTDTEYRTARRSLQYAHYTAEDVVRSMWDAAARLGFEGGKVFEPGMGVGNFAGMMTPELAGATQYSGLELDHTTARIARLLYPQWGVRQDDFTQAPLPKDTFDVVIGNPPFADVAIQSDPKYPQNFLLHDYFFAKSIDSVRPGGLMMFITSAGTMNKKDKKAREYIDDRADLVGAVRLPGNAFARNAGTSVTTDILMFRKRVDGERHPAAIDAEVWTNTVEVTLPNKEGKMMTGLVNRYFAENSDKVLGEEGFFDPLYENRYGVKAPSGYDLKANLDRVMGQLPQGIMGENQQPADRADIDFGTSEIKDGSFYIKDGQLMQQRDGVGVPVQKRGKGVTGGKTAAEMELIEGLIPIRDALRAVYTADLNNDTANADRARKRLNESYDAFVAKFGPINKATFSFQRPTVGQQEEARQEAREEARFTGEFWDDGTFDDSQLIEDGASPTVIGKAREEAREKQGSDYREGTFDPDELPDRVFEKRPNVDPFMDDPESYRLRSIEKYNDDTGEAQKGAVFFENIISKEQEPVINGVEDAVLYSLNKFGRLNMQEIASKAGLTEDEAIAQLGDGIYRLPGRGDTWVTADEYLSGNVRRKLREAKRAAERDGDLRRNVDALEAAQPEPLPPSEITANMGMPWIPTDVIEQFGTESLGLKALKVSYTPKLAQWDVAGDKESAAAIQTYGTQDKPAASLISDALNRKDPRVYREFYVDGKKSRELDAVATEAAQDKLREIKERFADWIWSDPARAERLAEQYNEEYNSIVVRQYDGGYLTTPGISASWNWRPHQKAVIARIIQSGNTYMAHAVGAGKTSAMIGAGMEMRRLGLVRKPMYSVPNHMLGQFTKEFYEQYPTARIAVADERRFHTSRRKQFIADVANEDLDAVIITHSAFNKIPISDDFQNGIVQEQVDEYRELLNEAKQGNDEGKRITVSRIEKQIEQLEQRLSGKKGKKKDAVYTFEEMGVDFVFVDEAHMFRKLDFATKMSNVKGISPQGSKQAWDLYIKTRYLETVNPGRNLVLASGTPVTNTMAELYTVSRYLQRGELRNRELEHFDAWAGAFGDTVTNLEQDPSGGYKPVTRFAKFVNVPELSSMVRQAMDVVTSNQLAQYVTRPAFKDGKRTMNLAEPSEALQEYQQVLASRMEAIAARKGPPKPGDDIILSVINDGRHAAIDMRLVDPTLKDDPGSKLNLLVDNVFRIWQETKRQKFYAPEPGGYSDKPIDTGPAAQMIFANLGLSGTRGFSTTDFIRAELIRRGVPKDQIANIKDYKSHVKKQRLFNDVNEGKVRILIGSTAKMATGVNAQRRLIALHNLDPLWYPADDEQRIGRALRQGNQNPVIDINDYSTKGTYDSTMWGMMETKARFIQGFFEGDAALRDMEDLGEASQYEQAKALTTADPRLIQLTEMRQELERLGRRESAHEREQYAAQRRVKQAAEEVDRQKRITPAIEADIAQRVDLKGDAFAMQIEGKTYTDRVEAGDRLLAVLDEIKAKTGEQAEIIGNISGFDIRAEAWGAVNKRVTTLLVERNGGRESEFRASESAKGTIQSLEAVIRGFDADLAESIERQRRAQVVIDETDASTKPFKDADKITALRQEIRDLERELTPTSESVTEKPGDQDPQFMAADAVGTGRTIAQVREDLAAVADGIPYQLVQSVDELPAKIRALMREQGIDEISGFYDPPTQTITLVADGIKSRKGAQRTLLHEAIGHMGIERVMGRENMGEFLRQVKSAENDPVVKAAYARVNRQYSGASETVKAAEVVAAIAESNPQHSLVNRIIQWMKRALRAMGFNVPFSNRDITEALSRAREAIREQAGPGVGRGAFSASQPRGYEVSDGFYAKLEKTIAEANIPGLTPSKRNPEGAAKGSDWLAYLKNRGIKESEWKWSGLRDFLQASKLKRFTRDQMLSEAITRRVQVETITTQGSKGEIPFILEPTSSLSFEGEEYDYIVETVLYTKERPTPTDFLNDGKPDTYEPGGYRLHVYGSPETDLLIVGHPDFTWLVVNEEGNIIDFHLESLAEARIQATYQHSLDIDDPSISENAAMYESYVAPGEYSEYYELKMLLPKVTDADGGVFTAYEHFPEQNIVTFARITLRGDGGMLLVEEAQSDWHQQGRKMGYRQGSNEKQVEALESQRQLVSQQMSEIRRSIVRKMGELAGVSQRENLPWHVQLDNVSQMFHNRFPEIDSNILPDIDTEQRLIDGEYAKNPPHMPSYGAFISQSAKAGKYRAQELLDLAIKHSDLVSQKIKLMEAVPAAPFDNDEWIGLLSRRLVIEAVNKEVTELAWLSGRELSQRWSEDFDELYINTYDKKMPALISRIVGEPATLMDPTEHFPFQHWVVEMSDEIRDKVETEGLPLFRAADDPGDPMDPEGDRKPIINRMLNSQPIDRVFRGAFDIFGTINERGEWTVGRRLNDRAEYIIKNATFSEDSRFSWLNETLEHARQGLIDRHGLDLDYVERERRRGLDERAIMAEVPDIMQALSERGIGTAEAKVLQAVLTGEEVAEGDMAALAEPIRKSIDDMGAEAVQLGLLSAESFERNRGAYLHRVYQKNEVDQGGLAKWVSQVSSKRRRKIIGNQFKGRGMWIEANAAKMRKYVQGFDEAERGDIQDGELFRVLDLVTNADQETARGIEPKAQKVYDRVFVPYDAGIPAGLQGYVDRGMWEVRGKKGGDFVLWRDFTKEERTSMGEVVDARYTIAKTYMGMAHDLSTGRFFRDIALNADWSLPETETPKKGTAVGAQEYNTKWGDPEIEWVKVPDSEIKDSNTKRYGQLAGRYVRAEIWRDLHELEQMQTGGLWRSLLTQWKLNKTARNPVVHLNNILSNMILMDMADVSTADLVNAARSMVKQDADYQDALHNGAFGADMVSQEIRKNTLQPILDELQAELQGNNSTEVRGRVVGRVLDAIWTRAKAFDRKMTSAYQMEDELFRMATYLRRKRDGADANSAAIQARDQFLNYDIRAPWVNAARRSVLPFISYTYRAIPVIAQSVTLRPWKLAKYATLAYLANALAYMMAGDDDEDEQRRSLRETESGNTWIGAPRMLRMPYSDDYGNPVFLDIRRWIPAGDVFDMNQGHGAIPIPAWLQFGGPLMLGAEFALNKQAFTGREITNDRTDDMWDKTAKVADWAWKSWMPSAAWMPGSWYWTKIGDAMTGGMDPRGRPYSVPQAVASSLGIKLRPEDIQQNFYWKGVEFNQIENELRAELRANARQYNRGLLSRKAYEKRNAKVIDKMETMLKEKKRVFTGED